MCHGLVRNEKTTISLMDWKIIMFNNKIIIKLEVDSSLFILVLHVKTKIVVTKWIWVGRTYNILW